MASKRRASSRRDFPIGAELFYTAPVEQRLPKGCRLITLPVRGDERGSLIALERSTGVPFGIERVYFIFDTQAGVARGFHAHRQLRQLVATMAGGCTLILDDGEQRMELHLDRRDVAVEIGFADCDGTRGIVHHGVNGLLVSGSGDRSANLADAMARLMGSPKERKRLGDAARVAKFDTIDTIADQWEVLLRTVATGSIARGETKPKLGEAHRR
jgi:hypothetical protein